MPILQNENKLKKGTIMLMLYIFKLKSYELQCTECEHNFCHFFFEVYIFPSTSQVAFNKLCKLGPVPVGLFDSLEEIDIGVNPICSWEEVCHLGSIPR